MYVTYPPRFSFESRRHFQSLEQELSKIVPQAACTLSTLLFLCLMAGHFQYVFAQSQRNIARKFDEFADIQESELKARLDNFAIHVQSEQGTKGLQTTLERCVPCTS
jgi:hypothetical protein